MAVLTAFFALRKGDGHAAGTAAKKVDVDKDDDLQDLYVLSRAFEASGDAVAAERTRQRICKGHDYLMKPLIVRALSAEHHPCAPVRPPA